MPPCIRRACSPAETLFRCPQPYARTAKTAGPHVTPWQDLGPKIGGGQTYSQLAAKSLAQPKNTALAEQVQTMFRGTTLRGMLLNAYGWWQMGQIMLISAFVAFGAAVVFLILSGLGFWHLRRTTPQSEMFPKVATKVGANA